MPYLAVEGAALYYEEWGPPAGRPLLLLHAALQTLESMEPLRKLAEPLGYRMAALDQRGHGRSVNHSNRFGIDLLADDAAALMEHLGFVQPDVVGFSLGGTVAVELARRGLVSKLVVMASRIQPSPDGGRAFAPESIQARMPLWVPQLEERHVTTPWRELARSVGLLLTTWPGFSPADLAGIGCPTLVVQGEKDQMVPLAQAEELVAAVPGARLQVVPHAGHPDLLYREVAMRAVAEFLGSASSW